MTFYIDSEGVHKPDGTLFESRTIFDLDNDESLVSWSRPEVWSTQPLFGTLRLSRLEWVKAWIGWRSRRPAFDGSTSWYWRYDNWKIGRPQR